jgi:hypothetical protein
MEAREKALVEALHQPLKPDVFKSEFPQGEPPQITFLAAA